MSGMALLRALVIATGVVVALPCDVVDPGRRPPPAGAAFRGAAEVRLHRR